MIQTEVTQLGACEHEVRARLPQVEYDRVYKEKMEQLRRRVRLPGFRPGRVPPHVLRRTFGADLHQQAVEELVRTHFAAVLDQSGLKPAVQPELILPDREASGEGFEFTLKVTTMPEIPLEDLAAREVERLRIEVEESDVEAVVERMMKNQSNFVPDDGRAAQEDDRLVIDFVGTIDGVPFEGGSAEQVRLVVGEGRFIPGFEEQLIGARAGDEVTVRVEFPDDYDAPHLAGRKAEFAVTVHEVARPEPWASVDELAQQLHFADAAELRAGVRAQLEFEAESIAYEANRSAVATSILAGRKVALPEALMQEQLRALIRDTRERMKQRGTPIGSDFFTDEVKAGMRERARNDLLFGLVVRALSDAGGIEVDEEGVRAELERRLARIPASERPAAEARIRGDKGEMERIRDLVHERSCIAWALERMAVREKVMTLSAWQEEADAARRAAEEEASGEGASSGSGGDAAAGGAQSA
ncbi:MAG: trigger factor [Zetaproteobacteria bacterium]|nr:MAG: trigger factor [Zetaproteobacteria bacterium]